MLFLVIARVLLSVSANTAQKRLVIHRASVSQFWLLAYLLMLGPACVLAAFYPGVRNGGFWTDILLGGLIDAFGNLAMVAALRLTDLSVFGPLNAFRPVLALFFGWLFLHETPTNTGALGVGVTVLGAVMLLKAGPSAKTEQGRGPHAARVLGLRLLGLSLSTFGAVFLKRAAGVASAEMTLAGWILCGLVCLAATYAFKPAQAPKLLAAFQRHRNGYLGHALLFLVMQWMTIRIFQETLLAYSFVFFQLGMILQVMAGRVVFREPAFKRRMAGCVIMALGSALIVWKG
jgi:uncharacterized membrane protein